MIKITGASDVQKHKSNSLYNFILIIGTVAVMYFGMTDFIYDELIIPQLNIYVSAILCAAISVFCFWTSLAVSNYVTALKNTADWILAIIVPVLVIATIKLLQYRERFLFAIILLAVMLLIVVYGIKTIITHSRKGLLKHIESDFRLMNIAVAILGIIGAVMLLITRSTCFKTITVDNYIAEQIEKYSDEYVEYITCFHPDKWEDLSYEEKLEAVCFLVKYEEDERGINTVEQINIIAESNDLLAYYDYYNKTIAINETYFLTADSYSIMSSVLHEFFHSWQHYAVDEYNTLDENGKRVVELVSDVDNWAVEFGASYIDGDQGVDSLMNYYEQDVEASAREYGEERCAEYKEATYIDLGVIV